LAAADGKKYLTDTFDYDGIIELAKNFPSKQANRFIEWITYSDETIDGYLFGGLYDFAGQIRVLNIAVCQGSCRKKFLQLSKVYHDFCSNFRKVVV